MAEAGFLVGSLAVCKLKIFSVPKMPRRLDHCRCSVIDTWLTVTHEVQRKSWSRVMLGARRTHRFGSDRVTIAMANE
tara:strand:- start:2002 stop:2232 length:231 start_codon:yes stop_codon:yes gene_type:complete